MSVLLTFNAFGLITIRHNRVSASVTVVRDGTAINRSLANEDVILEEVGKHETAAAYFGAWLENGNASRVTIREINNLRSGKPLAGIPQVKTLIKDILEQARHATAEAQ